jgi:hypothetical protein
MTAVFLIGGGLILLGSAVAFGALFLQWGHLLPGAFQWYLVRQLGTERERAEYPLAARKPLSSVRAAFSHTRSHVSRAVVGDAQQAMGSAGARRACLWGD